MHTHIELHTIFNTIKNQKLVVGTLIVMNIHNNNDHK